MEKGKSFDANIGENKGPVVCYSIEEAVNVPTESKTVFILSNERKLANPTTKRAFGMYYVVFDRFKDFLNNRHEYPHCHEILVDHVNNRPNIGGRLVFDFDIKVAIPDDFKDQIEETIIETIETNYNDVDIEMIEFVWSNTVHPHKVSKHLTIKHFYFENWRHMSRVFYKYFCDIWDSKDKWIASKDLIDFQVIRKSASLRMVGSKKIGGNILTMDDPNHTLTDSLIRIYFRNHLDSEQIIRYNHFKQNILTEEMKVVSAHHNYAVDPYCFNEAPAFKVSLYKKFFDMIDQLNPGVFKPGKIKGKKLSLMRTREAPCLLSKVIHENENAYIILSKENNGNMHCRYGCYRYCNDKMKTLTICAMVYSTNSVGEIKKKFEYMNNNFS